MKHFLRCAAVWCLALCLCLPRLVVPASAADATTYVLSFRPGANGSFDSAAVTYLEKYGTVQESAAGNLFVEVSAGTAFPTDILTYLKADSGYYYKGGLSGTAVESDETYVAQYGVLSGSGIAYTVRYVDSVSGTSVAESYTGYANAGDTITFSAKTVDGFAADSTEKTITVADGAILTFTYTGTGAGNTTNTIYGENTTVTQTVTQAAGANGTGTTTTDANAGTDTTTISDNNVPLNNGTGSSSDSDSASASTETITDSDTPLAQAISAHSVAIVTICAGIAAALLILFLVLRMRRKSES